VQIAECLLERVAVLELEQLTTLTDLDSEMEKADCVPELELAEPAKTDRLDLAVERFGLLEAGESRLTDRGLRADSVLPLQKTRVLEGPVQRIQEEVQLDVLESGEHLAVVDSEDMADRIPESAVPGRKWSQRGPAAATAGDADAALELGRFPRAAE
jgi:hypothetical protein